MLGSQFKLSMGKLYLWPRRPWISSKGQMRYVCAPQRPGRGQARGFARAPVGRGDCMPFAGRTPGGTGSEYSIIRHAANKKITEAVLEE